MTLTWQVVLAVLLWLWRNVVEPGLNPLAMADAFRELAVSAKKWGQVADHVMSWNMPVAFALGFLLGMLVMNAWSRKAA